MARCAAKRTRHGYRNLLPPFALVLLCGVILPAANVFLPWSRPKTIGSHQHGRRFLGRSAGGDPLDRLQRIGKPEYLERNIDVDSSGGAVTGGVTGAVLGGLLLGPFGAVFGANLGSEWGQRRAENQAAIAALGLDNDMIELAQRTASELADGIQSRERVRQVREDFLRQVAKLQLDVEAKYEEAKMAMEQDREDLARKALEEKLRLEGRLDAAKAELAKADQRLSVTIRNVDVLERRAEEVAQLLERASNTSGSQRTSLAAEASALGVVAPRDPLLDKFDALERGAK